MPNITVDSTGDGALGLITSVANSSPGHVEAAVAYIKDGTTVSGNSHISIHILGTGSNQDSILATLVDDYVYPGHTPAWTGHVFLQEGEQFLIQLRSQDTPTIRCVLKTLRRDP